MLFNSLQYILFLAIVVILFWNLPSRFRTILLLLASYIFYMSWSPPFGIIYGPVIFLDTLYFYCLSLAMLKWPTHKKKILIFGIVTELSLLAYFKYANFIALSFESISQWMNLPVQHVEFNIFLPLAISFTNFILISYLVDVYKGEEKPDPSFIRFATYVAFFPHLIAGPIVRARELLHQFDKTPLFDWGKTFKGIHLFFTGFGIKVFIADLIAPYVNLIYGSPDLQGFDTSWIATYAFAIQIFCDFWGYTLMAQGSAILLGYTLPENFNAPYFAKNITDFWRRWHMSLSRWLKDYIYIPLGGSRKGRFNTYRNLFITMGLGGLWHGANWTFVIWGLYQGILLSLHKMAVYLKINCFISNIIAWFITFHMVCIGWVFFRAKDFKQAFGLLETMFNPASIKGLTISTRGAIENNSQSLNGEFVLLVVIGFLLAHFTLRRLRNLNFHPLAKDIGIGFAYFILLYLGVSMGTQGQEFIYFQF